MSLDVCSKIISMITELGGLGSIIVAVKSYHNSRKQQNKLDRNNKLQLTLKIIKSFEAHIIPEMEKAEDSSDNKANLKSHKINLLEKIGIKKEEALQVPFAALSPSNQNKIKDTVRFNSAIHVINNMEQWSIYTEKQMVYYKLVYRETHHDYLSFIDEFHDVLNDARSHDDTYSACDYLYNKMKVSEQYEKIN